VSSSAVAPVVHDLRIVLRQWLCRTTLRVNTCSTENIPVKAARTRKFRPGHRKWPDYHAIFAPKLGGLAIPAQECAGSQPPESKVRQNSVFAGRL